MQDPARHQRSRRETPRAGVFDEKLKLLPWGFRGADALNAGRNRVAPLIRRQAADRAAPATPSRVAANAIPSAFQRRRASGPAQPDPVPLHDSRATHPAPVWVIDDDGIVRKSRTVADLNIDLGDRSYPIRFSADPAPGVREAVSRLEKSGHRLAVLTDRHVAEQQRERLDRMFGALPRLVVEPGEDAKSLAGLGHVLDFLAGNRIDRAGALFVAGGGVIGDLGGFAAAAYLRGIDFYQIPTTLLAMVDSSVGGKTGINLSAGKNLVGAFHQPRAVFIGTDVLATLPPREFAAGMAEVIKCGLLGDARLFEQLEREPLVPGSDSLPEVIRRCCALKARIVEADERELAPDGGRALLNLGHTFGHAIEQVAGYGRYLHGEAVAIGLAAAARLSGHLGRIPGRDVGRIESVVRAHRLPARLEAPLALDALFAAMARDKKVRAGLPRFVVLDRIGQAVTIDDVSRPLVEQSFREVGAA